MKTVSLSEDSINLLKLMTQDDGLHEAEVRLFQKVERIPHKGEGRVIILHGVPGLGKTYTVECLAEWSGTVSSCLSFISTYEPRLTHITRIQVGPFYVLPPLI